MIDSKMKRAIAARTMIPIIIGDILFLIANIAGILFWLADVSKHRFGRKKRAVNVRCTCISKTVSMNYGLESAFSLFCLIFLNV